MKICIDNFTEIANHYSNRIDKIVKKFLVKATQFDFLELKNSALLGLYKAILKYKKNR